MIESDTTFILACKDFFGFLPGTGLREFAQELKALTPADRVEIRAGLIKNGYRIPQEIGA